jgi:phosphotransferase system enzyme I (PtsI)
MCGEAAGDPLLIPALVGMGLKCFSMNTGSIIRARAIISAVSFNEMADFAAELLTRQTTGDVRWMLEECATQLRSEIFDIRDYFSIDYS